MMHQSMLPHSCTLAQLWKASMAVQLVGVESVQLPMELPLWTASLAKLSKHQGVQNPQADDRKKEANQT